MDATEENQVKLRVRDIITHAADITEVSREMIVGNCRVQKLARIRHAVYMVCREQGYSYPQIGAHVGGRDHSTIVHGVKVAQSFCERDKDFADLVAALRQTKPEFQYVGKLLESERPTSRYKSKIVVDGPEGTDTDAIAREAGTHRLLEALIASGLVRSP